jgi:hypothetical protein
LLGSTLWGGCASAPARGGGPGVVLAREDRIYISLADSLQPVEGDSLEFFDGGRRVAAGAVTSVLGADLAAVRLTSGSLRAVEKPERLRVAVRHSPPASPRTLRVGLPGPHRANLLFACSDVVVAAPGPEGTYTQQVLSARSYRLVRSAGAPPPERDWPETLLVRLFVDPTDEEIALERGELDVAVFWPGELSSHIREQPLWRGFLYGIRARGLLAAIPESPEPPGPDSLRAAGSVMPGLPRLRALNAGVFRGDLLPYEAPGSGPGRADSLEPVPPPGAARFEVDHDSPGWRLMERELGRGAPDGAPGVPAERVRLRYLDAPGREPGRVRDSLGVVPLFAIRCPVVSAPEFRSVVRNIGADRLADMTGCRPELRGP